MKSYLSFFILVLMGSCLLVSCDSQDEPAINQSETKQNVIKMFMAEGFVISDSAEKLVPDYKLSLEEAPSFLLNWKEYINSNREILSSISRSSLSSVPLKYISNVSGPGIYYCEYKGIALQFYGTPNMSNDAHLAEVQVYATGPSWPFTQSDTRIKYHIVWTSGYNHVFVTAYDKVTLEVEGVTLHQDAVLIDLIFVLDIAANKAIVNEKKI